MSRSRKFIAILLLFGLTSTAMLALAEAFLRLAYPVAGTLYRADTTRHFTFQPGAKKLHIRHPENGGSSHLVTIDETGFRGEGYSRVKEKRRVAVYGDSFVAGEYSPLEETFCAQLASKLGNSSEVINAGVTGYGPDQTLLKMETEFGELSPDVLLFLICCENDTIDLVRNRLLRPDTEGQLLPTGATLPHHLQAQLNPPRFHPRQSHLLKMGVRVLRNFNAKPALSQDGEPANPIPNFLAKADNLYESWMVKGDLEAPYIIEDFYDIGLALQPQSEASLFKAKLMRSILLRMKTLAESNGIPLHVITIPSVIDSLPDYDDPLAEALRAHPDYDPKQLTRFHSNLLSELEIPHLDLYEDFRSSPKPLFFEQHDSHWNGAGQERAAERAVKLIAR